MGVPLRVWGVNGVEAKIMIGGFAGEPRGLVQVAMGRLMPAASFGAKTGFLDAL